MNAVNEPLPYSPPGHPHLPNANGCLGVLSVREGDKADAAVSSVVVLRRPENQNHFLHWSHFGKMDLDDLLSDLEPEVYGVGCRRG
jgi:hypothetical protein